MSKQPEKTEFEKRLEAELAAQEAAKAAAAQASPSEDALEAADDEEELPEVLPALDVKQLMAERDELKEQLLRTRAEFENYRKRVTRDAEAMRLRAAENLIRDLLPVIDNLELALQHADDASGPLAEGIEMVVRQFHDTLRRAGLEPIPAVGEPFNPSVHEAVMQASCADLAPNSISQEFQRGYKLGDYVLRPARVAVNMGQPAGDESTTGDGAS